MISKNSLIVIAEDQVSSHLGGEVVILNLKTGKYYSLNETGSQIWSLIGQPMTVSQIQNQLLAEYDVAPDQCELGLLNLLQELMDRGMVMICTTDPDSGPDPRDQVIDQPVGSISVHS